MGLLIGQLVQAIRHDADDALACADAARLLRMFVALPTPELTAALNDGSLMESARELAAHLPLSAADKGACTRLCEAYSPNPDGISIDELRKDYTRLFAHPKKPLVKPFESAFNAMAQAEKLPLIAVNRTAQELDRMYARCGFCTNRGATLAGDHIAVELSFFAAIIEKAATANGQEQERLLDELQAFAKNHMLAWWGAFFDQVGQHASTSSYAFIGKFGALVFA